MRARVVNEVQYRASPINTGKNARASSGLRSSRCPSVVRVASQVFTVFIDQALSVNPVSWDDQAWNFVPVYPGYISQNTLELRSSCGAVMANISIHEEFTGSYGACSGSTNWAVTLPQSAWFHWTSTPSSNRNPGQ